MGLAFFGTVGAIAAGSSNDACVTWPQNRLLVGPDLQSTRFLLEGATKAALMPRFDAAEQRRIYHRTFMLSLPVAEGVSLFYTEEPKTIEIDRDFDRVTPLSIPIFFVGEVGETLEDLRWNADNVAFAPSESLDRGENFAEIGFRLRRGGSRFSDIRPFFRCGLPGLLLCEGSCPGGTASLASSLVNWVAKGIPFREEQASNGVSSTAPAPPTETPRAQAPAQPLQSPAAAIAPCTPACPTPPQTSTPRPAVTVPTPRAATPPSPSTEVPTSPPAAVTPVPPAPTPALPNPSGGPQPSAPPPSTPSAGTTGSTPPPQRSADTTPSAPAPETVAPSPPPASPAAPPRQGQAVTFTLKRDGGDSIEAAEVLEADKGITIDGAPLVLTGDALTAVIPEASIPKLTSPADLQPYFHHYRISSVSAAPGEITLVVTPLYVRADDVVIKIEDALHEAVKTCRLLLEVDENRRLGSGWQKIEADSGGARRLPYLLTDAAYRAELPTNVEERELLIDTSPGDAARLSNTLAGCDLEARPIVKGEELNTLEVLRFLRQSGPILIALLSTDSAFSEAFPAVREFWTSALDLVSSVSKLPFERKILARAQAPGVGPTANILEQATAGSSLSTTGDTRTAILQRLADGSRVNPGPLAIYEFKPVERYFLDLVLNEVRPQVGIAPRQTISEETLILVSGSLKASASDFCRRAVRGETLSSTRPDWLRRARKAFVIEVWSDAASEAMQREQRAEAADGAPPGVFRCKIGGADGDKVALYGLSPSAIREEGARTAVFGYLATQAEISLKP